MNCKVCGNTSAKNPSTSFFRFPKESTKCREWAVRCDLLSLHEKHGTSRFYKSFRICSDHFDPKDIIFDGRKKRLLQYAMPQTSVSMKYMKEEKQNIKKYENFQGLKQRLAKNLCRLCAEEDKNLTDIYGFKGRILNLENKLKYLPLVINKCDILPLRVCNQCMSKLNQFHDFIRNCIKAESKLKVMFDSEDYNTSCNFIEPNFRHQEKFNWDSRMKQSFNKTPLSDTPIKVQVSPDVIMCFSRNVEDEYCNQVFNDSFINEDESFFKLPEPNFAKTNQSNKHTNFVKEVDFSRNISFEHDYSNLETRDQIQFETKDQTENDQNFNGQTKHPCYICLETFQNSNVTNAQSLTNAAPSGISAGLFCKSCDEIFCTRFKLNEHISHHLEGKICDKKFHKVAFLKKCSLTHQLDNSNYSFINLRSSRMNASTSEKILKQNKNKASLFNGLNSKTLESSKINFKSQKRKCQFCDRFFTNRLHCLAHEKTHTGKTPYECKECGRGFRSRPSLRQHRSVHSDKRLYNCHECGMSFKRKDTLSNHLRIHTGERPFVCKICGFAFKQRGDCIKHEKNHSTSFEAEIKDENVHQLKEGSRPNVGSAISNFIIDSSQTSDGIPWLKENSLPSFIPNAEEITPVDSLEDIISSSLIPFNFLM